MRTASQHPIISIINMLVKNDLALLLQMPKCNLLLLIELLYSNIRKYFPVCVRIIIQY